MEKIILLAAVAFSVFASAETKAQFPFVQFKKAHHDQMIGLEFQDPSYASKVRRDAAIYADYRRRPTSDDNVMLFENCTHHLADNLFCDAIVNPPAAQESPDTALNVRQKFFKALLSLDDQKSRAKNCPAAVQVLSAITNNPDAKSLHPRSFYWRWVCAKEVKDGDEATRLKDIMFRQYPVTYHTLLVLQEDHARELEDYFRTDKDWPIAFRSKTHAEVNDWIAGIEALMENREDGAAAIFGSKINEQIKTIEPEVRLYLVSLMARVSSSIPSVKPVSKVEVALFEDHPEYISATTLRLLYPSDYQMADRPFIEIVSENKLDVDPFLLAGLIHQESALNPNTVSVNEAYGLTQMLLPTATDQWRRLSGNKTAEVTKEQMEDPVLATKLGAADLRRRLKSFSDNTILALASYNAGEGRIKKWLKEFKSPIKTPQILADVLLMNRPDEFHVSQYVAQVLSKQFWYSRLYPDVRVP